MRRVLSFIVIGFFLGVIFPQTPPPEIARATTSCSSGAVTTDSSASPVIVVKFTAPTTGNGSCTWTVPDNVYTVDYLIVAGGGGGGSGGGGGGGVVTSYGTTNVNNSTNSASTPQSVNPGDDISVVIGGGGTGGAGGSGRYAGTATSAHLTTPGSGSNSSFGSVSAAGGGAGGSNSNGVVGGSSGGDSYDRNTSGGAVASSSSVVGAQSFGNDGGGSPGGSYSAGGGGGGAGAAGGNARQLAAGCGLGGGGVGENCTAYYHGGGNGGRGIRSSITGSLTEYGCGGGGGINGNSNVAATNGGGTAGCSTSGVGSRYANLYTDYTATTTTNNANATSAAASFGGGGGGTDPEDTRGGRGGSGVVIIRYTLVDSRCPNNGSQTVTNPIACPSTLTVSANGTAVDKIMRGTPVSFASSSATMTVLNTPQANPSSGNMAVSVISGDTLRVSVPSGSSLIGGTYPVTYRLSESSRTSDSYLLVTVEDPDVRVPEVLPVDPRAASVEMPSFILGSSSNVLVCLIQTSDAHGELTISGGSGTGVTRTIRTRGISMSGTRTNVANALSGITFDKAASDGSIVPSGDARSVRLTISNTDNGGNNSCNNGTMKTVEIRALGFEVTKELSILIGNN